MSFNWNLRVPYKYGNIYITLRQLEQIMLPDYHPEYIRRFLGWLHYKNGNVGAGGLSRTEQPDRPGFAPTLLVSFHWAGQKYNDGRRGACAVDTVTKDGPDPGDAHDGIPWSQVPQQGSAEAKRWGLHANVGSPTGVGLNESWHIQPIEIDGHASFVAAGRPAPRGGYPIPLEHDPYYIPPAQPEKPTTPTEPIPTPPISGDDDTVTTKLLYCDLSNNAPYGTWYLCGDTSKTWISNGNALAQFGFRIAEAKGVPVDYSQPAPPIPPTQPLTPPCPLDGFRYVVVTNANPDLIASYGPIVGPRPAGVDEYGRKL